MNVTTSTYSVYVISRSVSARQSVEVVATDPESAKKAAMKALREGKVTDWYLEDYIIPNQINTKVSIESCVNIGGNIWGVGFISDSHPAQMSGSVNATSNQEAVNKLMNSGQNLMTWNGIPIKSNELKLVNSTSYAVVQKLVYNTYITTRIITGSFVINGPIMFGVSVLTTDDAYFSGGDVLIPSQSSDQVNGAEVQLTYVPTHAGDQLVEFQYSGFSGVSIYNPSSTSRTVTILKGNPLVQISVDDTNILTDTEFTVHASIDVLSSFTYIVYTQSLSGTEILATGNANTQTFDVTCTYPSGAHPWDVNQSVYMMIDENADFNTAASNIINLSVTLNVM